MRNPLKTWLTLVVIASAYGAATVHSTDFATLRRNVILLNRGSVKCYHTTVPRKPPKKPVVSAHRPARPVKPVTDLCSALEEFTKVIPEIKKSTDRSGSLKKLRKAHFKLKRVLTNSKRQEEMKKIEELTAKVLAEGPITSPSTPSTSTENEEPQDSMATLKKSLEELQKPCKEPPLVVCTAVKEYAKQIDEIEKPAEPVERLKKLRMAHAKLQIVLRNSKREEERKSIRELSGKIVSRILLPPESATGATSEDEALPDAFAALKRFLEGLRKPCEDPPEKVCSALEEYAQQIEELGKPGDPVEILKRLQKAHVKLQRTLRSNEREKEGGEIRELSAVVVEERLLGAPQTPGAGSRDGASHDSLAELEEYVKKLGEPCEKPQTKVCSALEEYAGVIGKMKKTGDGATWKRDLAKAQVTLKMELERHGKREERIKIQELTTAFAGARDPASGSAAGTHEAAELEKYLQTLLKQCKK